MRFDEEKMMRETLKDLGYAAPAQVPYLPLERQFTSVHVTTVRWIHHFVRCGLTASEVRDEIGRIFPNLSGATTRSIYYYARNAIRKTIAEQDDATFRAVNY